MTRLSSGQKELIFDYCMGLASPEQIVEARKLISSDEEAAQIHSKLQATLAPLENITLEECPQHLVESTLSHVDTVAASSTDRLRQLIADEQRNVPARSWYWLGAFRKLATAAVFVIAGSILFTTFNYMRFDSQRRLCQTQQSNFSDGLEKYIADHDGKQPAVAMQAGAPWYKIGYQGDENHSNTRRLYALVKNGYIDQDSVVCPSCSKSTKRERLTASQIQTLRDFPDRRYINYSFQIQCRRGSDGELYCRKVLMADLSPLFENLSNDFGRPLQVRLNKRLLTINSANHRRKGQNVLFGDGHVEFLKRRFINLSQDDIFTLQNTDVYRGNEVPACTTDFFLAP
ncbi:MAG: hypothetical protein ACYTE3_15990 [Planctomycetota bacterium]|jgi:prepilin-type processing-associated H-X9-DG protein